jgi:hypothetical protein
MHRAVVRGSRLFISYRGKKLDLLGPLTPIPIYTDRIKIVTQGSGDASASEAYEFFANRQGRAASRWPGSGEGSNGGSDPTSSSSSRSPPEDPNVLRVIAFRAALGEKMLSWMESKGR